MCYRGDNAKDETGAAAVYQELSASPTAIQSANANLAYGCLPGHMTTQADAVRAYVQSLLKSKFETWVQIPPELWPVGSNWKKLFSKPMCRLKMALYGHPESGAHWENHLTEALRKIGGEPVNGHPSSFWFPTQRMLLTVYVDGLLLSGPVEHHDSFWSSLRVVGGSGSRTRKSLIGF